MSTKLVIIGAASASFGPGILQDAMHCDALRGGTLVLVDLHAERLAVMTQLAHQLNAAAGMNLRIESTTDRRQALPDAEFVLTSIAVKRNELWRQDYEIPLRYGFKHVLGENGGPGGLFHTLRNIPMMLDICRDMEELCPRALLLNYTNPESRVCLAVEKYSGIRAVGLCHGIFMGVEIVATLTGIPAAELEVTAAGLNHFLWMLAARRRGTGEDLYPLVRERAATAAPEYLPLSRKLLATLGRLPFPSDDHVGEYLGFAWETCRHHGYDFDAADRWNAGNWARLLRLVSGEDSIEAFLQQQSGEIAFEIIRAMRTGIPYLAPAVNIPNRGAIPNLPADALVEVPALVDADGLHGICVGDLPGAIAALCRTQVAIQHLAVDAAMTGSRALALQALLLDPVVTNLTAAEQCLDEMLARQAPWLPRFAGVKA